MLFNSFHFAIFYVIIFFFYWFVTHKSLKLQNILLLVASYYFYACWDWRFLFLLIFSTLLDYYTGLKMQDCANIKYKKIWFWLSIIVNLSFLGVFKYYNFFAESFATTLAHLGFSIDVWTLHVILPVGISFYTFHGLSYVLDTYKGRIKAERSFVDYAVFVSFFPLLVAGPIERATHLLPQLKKERTFDYAKAADGLRQILWGLFKKVVIADNCARFVNEIFGHSDTLSGSTLVCGIVFFAYQVYGDFSGYSDIALGTARLLGIELLWNFSFPYFSRDIAEFWKRWHISLSTWFNDYVFFPLCIRWKKWEKVGIGAATIVTFVLSGFWHGANWTFLIWGFLNGVYLLPTIFFPKRKKTSIVAKGKYFPTLKELFSIPHSAP